MTFQVERFDGIKLDSIRMLSTSGLEYTPLGPPALALEPVLPERAVQVGDTFEIGYSLKNTGDVPANDVAVGLIYPQEGFRLLGETPHSYASVPVSVIGSFRLTAISPGTHQVLLGVESSSGQPAAQIQAVVHPPDKRWLSANLVWLWVALSGLLVGVAMLALSRPIGRVLKSNRSWTRD